MPSPTSETLIPAHRSRKSRPLSGRRRPTREMPPGRSRPSKLCCIRVELPDVPALARQVFVERAARHRPPEQEALSEVEPEVLERVDLVGMLDPLGHHLEAEGIEH